MTLLALLLAVGFPLLLIRENVQDPRSALAASVAWIALCVIWWAVKSIADEKPGED